MAVEMGTTRTKTQDSGPSLGSEAERVGANDRKPDRNVYNVFANGTGQVVTTISGFVLPRLINDSIGPAELGVWDFGWSMRSIIAISALGMGSSAGHYVSRFRATGEWEALNCVLSAMLGLLFGTALLAVVVTSTIVCLTPRLMQGEEGTLIVAAQWMVSAMGAASVLQMVTIVYGGVLVGCRRFDLFNLVEIVADIGVVVGVIISLYAGWGLYGMAASVGGRQIMDLIAKRHLSHRLCPELHLRPRWTDWTRMREVAGYGSKTLTDSVATIIQGQVIVALVLFYHDMAAVAVFARSVALIRITTRFVMGFARILVPKAGEAHELGDKAALKHLLVEGTRVSIFLALPVVVLLVVMGGPILRLWMGGDYADPTVLIILVMGYLPFFAQRGTWHVLLGVGAHGLPALASLVGAVATVALSFLFLGVADSGLPGAALAVALPIGLVNLLVLPYAGCRAVGIAPSRYWLDSLRGPVVTVLPFGAVLLASRLVFADRPLLALLAGLLVGGPVLLITYWRFVLPSGLKARLGRLRPRASPAAPPEQRS